MVLGSSIMGWTSNDGDIAITDGVATNGLAHAIITALSIAGIKYLEDVQNVEVEMYRANPIDVDDTTSIRITPVSGPIITANLTLCGAVQLPAVVEVVGETGIASFRFKTDDVDINSRTIHYGRTNLLENLLAHRDNGTPLLVPLRATGAFMCVLEAIRTGHQPVHVERKWVEKRGEGRDMHPVIEDVDGWIRKAADIDGLLSEAGAPWAFTGRDGVIAQANLDGKPIFQVLDGLGTTPFSSPRPYIHPIQTLGGVEVTATRPADHDWHTGLGMTIPDVNGTTFWGGPTYVRGQGYIPLDNYGTMVTESLQYLADTKSSSGAPVGLTHTMAWRDSSSSIIVREIQTLRWTTLPSKSLTNIPGYELSFSSSMTAASGPVSIGSPGTNGRENAGYGGFFWRLPHCSDVEIHSATEQGENQVHGSISPWISWSARFKAGPGKTGDATLVIVSQDESRSDPWFVRCTGYPGIGSAIAWEERVEISAGETITRTFKCAVLDGRWSRSIVQEIAEGLHVPA